MCIMQVYVSCIVCMCMYCSDGSFHNMNILRIGYCMNYSYSFLSPRFCYCFCVLLLTFHPEVIYNHNEFKVVFWKYEIQSQRVQSCILGNMKCLYGRMKILFIWKSEKNLWKFETWTEGCIGACLIVLTIFYFQAKKDGGISPFR